MLDLGANLSRRRSLLSEFARIGSAYAVLLGSSVRQNCVADVGVEAHKGPQYLRDTAVDLARDPHLNFVGYIEANLLFEGIADVVVTDGFTGNVALKSIEAALAIAHRQVQDTLNASNQSAMQAVADEVSTSLNSQTYNGASLVGLQGVIVQCHGNTSNLGIRSALTLAKHEVHAHVPSRLASCMERLQGRII